MIRVKGDPIEWGKPALTKRIRPSKPTATLVVSVTKEANNVTRVTKGRPRLFVTVAEKQRAYRERKRAR